MSKDVFTNKEQLCQSFDNRSRSKNLKPKKSRGGGQFDPPPLKASRVNTKFEKQTQKPINFSKQFDTVVQNLVRLASPNSRQKMYSLNHQIPGLSQLHKNLS